MVKGEMMSIPPIERLVALEAFYVQEVFVVKNPAGRKGHRSDDTLTGVSTSDRTPLEVVLRADMESA